MKILFTCFLATAFATAGLAQQASQYSMYMLNKYAFNPAYAGMDNSLSMTGVYRSQWVGLDGSPESRNFNGHVPLYFASGGVGLSIENETIGSWRQTMAAVTYDYQMLMGRSGVLSIGLSAGLLQRELDGLRVRTPGGIYDDQGNLVDHQDQLLTSSVQSGTAPTVHVGAFYQGEKLEVGISAMNLIEKEISLSEVTFKPERTYFLLLGYHFDLSKKMVVEPSVLVKSSVEQTQVDLSVLVRYDENIFAGASFRGVDSDSRDALALIGGFKLSEKITLAYSYDLTLSTLKTVNSGSHEIMLNYNLGKPIGKGRPPQIIYNPRSL